MADIHHLLTQAMENRGTQHEVSWTPLESLSEYTLIVEANPRGGDAEWRMYTGAAQRTKPLWTYISCDVLLVFNLVTSSCGEMRSDGGADASGRTSNTYYRLDAVKTQDDMAPFKTTVGSETMSIVRASSALTGDLAHVQMPTLLQSILMAKMTGLLKIESDNRIADVYFVDGVPVHGAATDTVGEESIFELLTWKEGTFNFKPNSTTDARTIKQNLDALLLQGMQLIDNAAYLRNLGLRPEAHVVMKDKNLSERQFETKISQGAPINLALQKHFYKSIPDCDTVQDLLEKLRIPRSQWISVMCNLLRCDVISIEQPSNKRSAPPLEPKAIDKRAIQNVMMSLRSPETGMFTYPAFLYFIEQEYFRAYRSASPISVIVFQMRIYSANMDPVREPLPLIALSEATRRISRVKRHVDLLAHYETYDYALLLPNTKTGGAQTFANRVVKALTSESLVPGLVDTSNLSLAFGIASIPEDFHDLSLLLTAAEVAKNAAAHAESPIVLYRDIK
jgi:GGDEF domain-containing protein